MELDLDSIKANKSTPELLEFSIINVDKPSGPTSFTVSQFVKNALGLRKTSHMGTLDPAVSGILPVTLNRACRLSDYLMHRNKKYVGIMRLHSLVPEEQLKETIQKFVGKIIQLPPVRSRVKRAEREREVKSFEILEQEETDILFKTEVQAGTYIRKICHDMGGALGVGAHMLELRRTQAGAFHEPAATLYELEAAVDAYKKGDERQLRVLLVPGEIIGTLLPLVNVAHDAVKKLYTGSPLFFSMTDDPTPFEKGEKIAVFDNDIFIGCYRVVHEGSVMAVPEFVLN